MLRNILLFTIPVLVASLTVPTSSHCSKGCNCNEAFAAVCDTLNLEPFEVPILRLKIVHPKVPLILKGEPFHIRGLEKLNSISIENATILEIDKSAFKGIPLLSQFTIVNANIPGITNSLAFASAHKLRTLRIANSTLSKFEFVKSESLEELDLSGCRLREISKNSFAGLPYLTYLNLANNNISSVDPLAFSGLLSLEEVVLSNNNISSLNPDVFKNNTELDTLDLSNNPLKKFDVNFESDLEKLVLRSVQLKRFTEEMSENLLMLNYLDLSGNKIDFTNTTPFANMEDLEYIDLSNNELTYLNSEIFKSNHRLQKVILDNNKFTVMPRFVCHNDSFEIYFLSCRNCGLTSLPMDTFKHLSAVVILELTNNHLNGINLTAIQYLPSLIELDLSRNNISVLNPYSFQKSSALEKLNLSGNPITRLDVSLFHKNGAIKSIDLSFCKIQQLWKQPTKQSIPSLLQLNVANNSITAITPADLQVIPSLRVLDISNNPIQCDQTLRDTITWLSEHEVSPASISPTWKTHEPVKMLDAAKVIDSSNRASSWRDLAKQRCAGFDFDNEEEEIDVLSPGKADLDDDNKLYDNENELYYDYLDNDDQFTKSVVNLENFDEKDLQFADDEAAVDIAELAYESTKFRKQHSARYSLLWPSLVFVFTALSVLVIAANIMLLMLRTRMMPRQVNLPHIRIPQWTTTGKMKKHSGSVYQPLSEDKSEPSTPIISRKEQVPTHNYTPKSIV